MNELELIQSRLREEAFNPTADPSRALEALRPDGSFSGVDYFTADRMKWNANEHLSNLKTMVEAAYSKGNPHYGDAALKTQISAALRYWTECGRADCDNWWWKEIGLPQLALPILILSPEEMTDAQRAVLQAEAEEGSIFREQPLPGAKERPVASTGANLTDKLMTTFRIAAACGQESQLDRVWALLENELRVFERVGIGEMSHDGEGIKADHSFHQHLDSPQFGGYGEVFLEGVNFLLRMTRGTRFFPTPRALNVYADFLLDGISWACQNGYKDFTITGRGFSRPSGAQGGSRGIAPFVRGGAQLLCGAAGVRRKAELEDLLHKRLEGEDRGDGCRYFWLSDYMACKRPGFHIGLKTSSVRTKAGEVVNNENLLGYYLADGVTCMLRRGDEYEDAYPLLDWNRLPGTTALRGELHTLPDAEEWYGEECWNWRGTTSFVGGVSDGVYGAALMDYARCGLFVHKAWFFTRNGLTALGCGINTLSKETREVDTCVNQCRRRGPVRLRVDGKWHDAPEGAADVTGAELVCHDGTAYVVQQGAARLLLEERRGDWGTINLGHVGKTEHGPMFELWIPHGAQPRDGAYAYTIAPGLEEAELDGFTPPQILRNDEKIQAVWQDGLLQAAVWKVDGITAPGGLTVRPDKKCLLMAEETEDGGLRISASNPANLSKLLCVTVNRPLPPLEDGECWVRPTQGGSVVRFRLNEGVWAGSTSIYDSRTGFTPWKDAYVKP